MNTQNYGMPPQPGPLAGIIQFLAVIGLLTIFAFGGVLGMLLLLWLNRG